MLYAQKISSLVHSIRKKEKIKVRQPLSAILIPVNSKEVEKDLRSVEKIILSEVNVKQVKYVYDNSKVFIKKIKPNYKKLGSLYGAEMSNVSKRIMDMNQDEINMLEKKGAIELNLDNDNITLKIDQAEISFSDIEGQLVASNDLFTIALEISINEDLLSEGISREFINKIQNERKNMSLEVTDKIDIQVENDSSAILKYINDHKSFICNETQSIGLKFVDNLNNSKTMEIKINHSNINSEIVNYYIIKI